MSISLEDLRRKCKSMFGLVICAATRAKELVSGAQPLIQTKSKKISTIALEEIAKSKVYFEVPKPKPVTSWKTTNPSVD